MIGQSILSGTKPVPQKQRFNYQLSVKGDKLKRSAINSTKYDYIILGGGAAGCVMANKLSEDQNNNVLLIEAGPADSSISTTVPGSFFKLFMSDLDWNLFCNKEDQLNDRSVYLARGKLLGGSSSTNATLYHRGSRADYDSWGVDGWTGDDVLQYFKACEGNTELGPSKYHNKDGPYKVENPRYYNATHKLWIDSATKYGLKRKVDFNDWDESQIGCGSFQVTQSRGQRVDGYKNYLKPVVNRPNLTINSSCRVSKIATEQQGDNAKAVGVKYIKGSNLETAELNQGGEVILSCGAIHSPHVLQLSGIGPAATLNHFGIDVVADLPGVGQNLQDHPAVVASWEFDENNAPSSTLRDLFNDQGGLRKRAILNYLLRRRGPLCTVGCEYGGFLSSTGGDVADVQIRVPPGRALHPDGVQTYIEFQKLRDLGQTAPPGISTQVIACRAKSKGSVGLKSADPMEFPSVNTGYLTDKADVDSMIWGLKEMRKLVTETSPVKDAIKKEVFPGPGVQSDSDLEDYLRETIHSSNALVGTCKLGNPGDDSAVVGPDLKVRGVDCLRVVDASVMPIIPGGQTGAPTFMIATKAAALIAKEAASKRRESTEAGSASGGAIGAMA